MSATALLLARPASFRGPGALRRVRQHTPVDDEAVTVGSLQGPQTPASSRWLFVRGARCRGRPLSQPASGFASGLTSGRPAARLLGVLHLLLRRSSPPSAVGACLWAWLPAFRRWSTLRSVVKLVNSLVSGQAGSFLRAHLG